MREFRPSLRALQQTDLRAIKCQSVAKGMPNMLFRRYRHSSSIFFVVRNIYAFLNCDRRIQRKMAVTASKRVHDGSRSLCQMHFFIRFEPFGWFGFACSEINKSRMAT